MRHPLCMEPLEVFLDKLRVNSLHLFAAWQPWCTPCRKPIRLRADYLHLLRHHLHRHLNLAPHFLILCHHFLHRNAFDNLLHLHLCEAAACLPARLPRCKCRERVTKPRAKHSRPTFETHEACPLRREQDELTHILVPMSPRITSSVPLVLCASRTRRAQRTRGTADESRNKKHTKHRTHTKRANDGP